MTNMTEIERAALAAFAKEYGHQWKAYLKAAWLSYRHNGRHMGGADTGTLRAIRNERGMRWLEKVRTADLAEPAPATFRTSADGVLVLGFADEQPHRWQGMTNAEHLADCERLEANRKEVEAFAPKRDQLQDMSTGRLSNMLALLTEHPNGDPGCVALAVRVRAELERRDAAIAARKMRFADISVAVDGTTQDATIYRDDGAPVGTLIRKRVGSRGAEWTVYSLDGAKAGEGELVRTCLRALADALA